MHAPATPPQTPLDASKERLGQALRHLQQLVEGKQKLIEEQQRKLAQLTAECNSLKQANATALAQLNQSITQLETLMGGNKTTHGNS